MAGKRCRPSGENVVGRAKSADPRLHRQVVRTRGDRKTAGRMVRKDFAKLFRHRIATGNSLRDEIPTAEAAANPGYTRIGGRFEIGKGGGRSKRDGRKGD